MKIQYMFVMEFAKLTLKFTWKKKIELASEFWKIIGGIAIPDLININILKIIIFKVSLIDSMGIQSAKSSWDNWTTKKTKDIVFSKK